MPRHFDWSVMKWSAMEKSSIYEIIMQFTLIKDSSTPLRFARNDDFLIIFYIFCLHIKISLYFCHVFNQILRRKISHYFNTCQEKF